MKLAEGGSRLFIDRTNKMSADLANIRIFIGEFVDFIDERRSSVDVRPLRLVADCFLASSQDVVEPILM